MKIYHKNLASGRWETLTFSEKMSNIGSEVIRAINWKLKNEKVSKSALERSFELIDLTLDSEKKYSRLKEIARVREILADFFYGENKYRSDRIFLTNYFLQFNYLCQRERNR